MIEKVEEASVTEDDLVAMRISAIAKAVRQFRDEIEYILGVSLGLEYCAAIIDTLNAWNSLCVSGDPAAEDALQPYFSLEDGILVDHGITIIFSQRVVGLYLVLKEYRDVSFDDIQERKTNVPSVKVPIL